MLREGVLEENLSVAIREAVGPSRYEEIVQSASGHLVDKNEPANKTVLSRIVNGAIERLAASILRDRFNRDLEFQERVTRRTGTKRTRHARSCSAARSRNSAKTRSCGSSSSRRRGPGSPRLARTTISGASGSRRTILAPGTRRRGSARTGSGSRSCKRGTSSATRWRSARLESRPALREASDVAESR